MKIKKKKLMLVALWCGLSLGASAALVDFQFNDGPGVELNDALNSGTISSNWNFKYPANTLDAAGNLYVTNSASATRKVENLGISGGTVTMEWRYSSWDFDGATQKDQGLSLKLADSAGANVGINLSLDNALSKTKVRGFATTGGSQTLLGTLSGSDLVLQVIADLDAGTVSSRYNLGDSGWNDLLVNDANGISNVDTIIMSSGTAWANTGTDHVALDYLKVIPEPETLGLVAFMGGGILFIRRRFMI